MQFGWDRAGRVLVLSCERGANNCEVNPVISTNMTPGGGLPRYSVSPRHPYRLQETPMTARLGLLGAVYIDHQQYDTRPPCELLAARGKTGHAKDYG